MLFTWLRNRRRRRLVERPFPPHWLDYLHKNVAQYQYLSESERARLHDDLRIFIAEKYWEGCGGLTMTDEIKATIAAQVCLLVLGLKHNYFERVQSILVYPRAYRAVGEQFGPDGLIHPDWAGRLGEAHYRGPVVLSWADVLEEGRHPEDGQNVVYHEFAHQLDMLDGAIDGTPPLETAELTRSWRDVMTAEYHKLIDDARQGRATLLDKYGTKNEAEFFAVATEGFFVKPVAMARRHPQLYELLRQYYHQDPAARMMPR
jgi:MtfA peptidase